MRSDQILSSLDVNPYTETTPIVSESDMLRLKAYVHAPTVSVPQRALLETLEAIAVLVDPDDIPPDLVTMNTTVECTVAGSGESVRWTLVYPEEADYPNGRLSVLSPAGIALLGARCGQTVVCRPPSGVQVRYVIREILSQPESRRTAG